MGRKKGSKNRKGRNKKAAKTIGNDMLGGILIVIRNNAICVSNFF